MLVAIFHTVIDTLVSLGVAVGLAMPVEQKAKKMMVERIIMVPDFQVGIMRKRIQ